MSPCRFSPKRWSYPMTIKPGSNLWIRNFSMYSLADNCENSIVKGTMTTLSTPYFQKTDLLFKR